jgi:DNA polymerase-1
VNFDVLDAEKVKKKYGVPPDQIADYLALKGDPVDNIPGVPKIGEKTAVDLLSRFHTMEEVLERREEIARPGIRQTLLDNEYMARLSKVLAIIYTELPISFKREEFRLQSAKTNQLVHLLDELEFIRLKERIFSNTFYKKFLDQPAKKEELAEYEIRELGEGTELDNLFQKIKEAKEFCFLSSVSNERLKLTFLLEGIIYLFHSETSRIPPGLLHVLFSEKVTKLTYQSKPILKALIEQEQKPAAAVYDIVIKHYLLSPEANHQLDKIIAQELGISIPPDTSPRQKLAAELQHLRTLKEMWEARPMEKAMEDLYRNIDFPLVTVIARMELNGISIDTDALRYITLLFQEEMDQLEEAIFKLAGEKLNLRSTQQTSALFSRILKDSPVKKTKTGQLSTSEASLMEYAEESEVAEHLLRFRKLSKLVSTYTESLPNFINPKTGRVHADFLQVSTATGRLSCNNPNLQNLPIRSEEGREVRRAVIPENNNYLILSADYSQIELRILAGISKDEGLIHAFLHQQDVHTITAAKVFNVEESAVTEDMRSKAKMVNYGIAYGISAFGLSQRLKISRTEGKEIIEQYFKKFPGIKRLIDETIHFARERGFTETLTGRKRYIENINSKNGTERKAAERIAINAPIQGLAADMIRIAMIHIDKEFQSRNLKSKMILQVHDELVFEVYKPEIRTVADIVKDKMEKAFPIQVPLEVNIGVGKNWLDLEY